MKTRLMADLQGAIKRKGDRGRGGEGRGERERERGGREGGGEGEGRGESREGEGRREGEWMKTITLVFIIMHKKWLESISMTFPPQDQTLLPSFKNLS